MQNIQLYPSRASSAMLSMLAMQAPPVVFKAYNSTYDVITKYKETALVDLLELGSNPSPVVNAASMLVQCATATVLGYTFRTVFRLQRRLDEAKVSETNYDADTVALQQLQNTHEHEEHTALTTHPTPNDSQLSHELAQIRTDLRLYSASNTAMAVELASFQQAAMQERANLVAQIEDLQAEERQLSTAIARDRATTQWRNYRERPGNAGASMGARERKIEATKRKRDGEVKRPRAGAGALRRVRKRVVVDPDLELDQPEGFFEDSGLRTVDVVARLQARLDQVCEESAADKVVIHALRQQLSEERSAREHLVEECEKLRQEVSAVNTELERALNNSRSAESNLRSQLDQSRADNKAQSRRLALLKTSHVVLQSVLESERTKHTSERNELLEQIGSVLGKCGTAVRRKDVEIESLCAEVRQGKVAIMCEEKVSADLRRELVVLNSTMAVLNSEMTVLNSKMKQAQAQAKARTDGIDDTIACSATRDDYLFVGREGRPYPAPLANIRRDRKLTPMPVVRLGRSAGAGAGAPPGVGTGSGRGDILLPAFVVSSPNLFGAVEKTSVVKLGRAVAHKDVRSEADAAGAGADADAAVDNENDNNTSLADTDVFQRSLDVSHKDTSLPPSLTLPANLNDESDFSDFSSNSASASASVSGQRSQVGAGRYGSSNNKSVELSRSQSFVDMNMKPGCTLRIGIKGAAKDSMDCEEGKSMLAFDLPGDIHISAGNENVDEQRNDIDAAEANAILGPGEGGNSSSGDAVSVSV